LLIIVLGILQNILIYLGFIMAFSPYLDRGKNLDLLSWIRLDVDRVIQVTDLALENHWNAPEFIPFNVVNIQTPSSWYQPC
jgi:hypothetical protein